MPGRGSYGPAGKWIHDRAHRIMSESPETPKGMAYAIATQQGHKVGKSPKGFRTPEGVATAKAKFSLPKKEYRKTAGAADAAKVVGLLAVPAAAGTYLGLRMALPKRTREGIKKEHRDPRLYSNLRGMLTGESRAERVAAHKRLDRSKDHSLMSAMREGWSRGGGREKEAGAEEAMAKRLKTLCSLRDKGYTSDRENEEIKYLRDQLGEGGAIKTAVLAGFFDELEKAASLAAAARFGVGVLLGSLLWNSMGSEEKQELKERAQEATGESKMPPIIIAPGKSPTMAMREMAKADPYLPRVERQLGQLRDFFPEELRREKIALATPPPGEEQKKIKLPQFLQPMRYSEKGLMGNRKQAPTFKAKEPPKPPPPNIQSVATKIRKP